MIITSAGIEVYNVRLIMPSQAVLVLGVSSSVVPNNPVGVACHYFLAFLITTHPFCSHVCTAIYLLKMCNGAFTTNDIACEHWPQELEDQLAGNVIQVAANFRWESSSQQALDHQAPLLI